MGHHWVPVEVIYDFWGDLLPEARDSAFGASSGPTYPSHRGGIHGGVDHKVYNKIVADELRAYMKKHGITKMNADQMFDFSEKMRQGLNHKGEPHKELKAFNDAIRSEHNDYLAGGKNRKWNVPKTAKDAVNLGEKYRRMREYFAGIRGVLLVGALTATLEELLGPTATAGESDNFRRAVEALTEGDVATAERYLFGTGGAQLDGFVGELIGRGHDKAAMNFRDQFYKRLEEAKRQEAILRANQ